jgi:hypothetical protein
MIIQWMGNGDNGRLGQVVTSHATLGNKSGQDNVTTQNQLMGDLSVLVIETKRNRVITNYVQVLNSIFIFLSILSRSRRNIC